MRQSFIQCWQHLSVLLQGILLLLLSLTTAQASDSCDWSSVDASAQSIVDQRSDLDGLSLVTGVADHVSHLNHLGQYDSDTVVPLASASKLLSGVLIMMLVDEGLIDLDAPVSDYLPQFTGDKASMTTRQMFSHTSGLPGNRDRFGIPTQGIGLLSDASLTLAESVDEIACCVPLIYSPGEGFSYGGFSMQVAGRVAEVVTGEDFEQLFIRKVATPLGITSMDYQGLGLTRNYRVGGSARSTLRDYSRVLQLLLARGEYRGQRLLSEAAVDNMLQDNKLDKTVYYVPSLVAALYLGYGIGGWLHFSETGSQQVAQFSSKGAFDTMPWIDIEQDTFGIILLQNHGASLNDEVIDLFDEASAQMSAPQCQLPLDFEINPGLSGAWYNPETPGQGLMLDVMGQSGQLFAAWFTWELETVDAMSGLGNASQRWLTAQGGYQGDTAELLVYSSDSGRFDSPDPVDTVAVGSARLQFDSCTSGTLEYTLDQPDMNGSIPLVRLTEDEYCRFELEQF